MGGNVSRDDGTKTVTLTKDGAAGKPGETPITPGNDTEQTPSDNSETQTGTKSLVECFSVTGNTKALAEKIAEQQDENARPEISEKIPNFENYDVIFLGYPILWGTMPKIINTFTESFDFSGKTVIPFCTSGGSGISASVLALISALHDAKIGTGLRGSSYSSDSVITEWFTQNAFEKSDNTSENQKILLSWDEGSAEISLYDNLTAKDLISRLPLEVNIEDYNSTEKIIRFDDKLTEDSTAKGVEPVSGDVTVYAAPWGNIAIFYKPFSYSDDLIKLGKVESGLDALAEISDGTKVTITKL